MKSLQSMIPLFLLAALSAAICGAGALYVYGRTIGSGVLGAQDRIVTRISGKDIVYAPGGGLQYYYELEPDRLSRIHEAWLPEDVTYTINSAGMNDLRSYSPEKSRDVFRILSIGDSFTFGQYVNTHESYPSVLTRMLERAGCPGVRYEVLNFGVPGYDIQYTVERFVRQGSAYNPDIVLWLINDHNLLQIRDELQPLKLQLLADTSSSEHTRTVAEGRVSTYISQAASIFLEATGEEEILRRQRGFLDRFSGVYDGPLVLGIFADASQKHREFLGDYARNRRNTRLFSDVPALGDHQLLADGHPNADGQTVIAGAFFGFLKSAQLLACQ